MEIQINSLQKSIDGMLQEITELQQIWLRQQSELVRLAKDKEEQSVDVEKLKKQLTILLQKKIRTEGWYSQLFKIFINSASSIVILEYVTGFSLF